MTTVEQLSETYEPDLDEPALAHIPTGEDRFVGLCGVRILGVPAPPEAPKCGECTQIAQEILFILGGQP